MGTPSLRPLLEWNEGREGGRGRKELATREEGKNRNEAKRSEGKVGKENVVVEEKNIKKLSI